MRLAVVFSFAVGALPISVMLLSVTATWMEVPLSVGSLRIAFSISDCNDAVLVVLTPVPDVAEPVMEPELVCPMGAVLSPVWLEGAVVVWGAVVENEPLVCEPVSLEMLEPAWGVELVLGEVVPPIAVELPVVEPVPVAPVCAPMEPFALAPLF